MARATYPQLTLRGVLRGLFLKDVGRKVVALVLAVGLWFLISEILRDALPKSISLAIITNQSDLQYVSQLGDSIKLKVPEELVVLEPKAVTTVQLLLSGPRTLLEEENLIRISALYDVPPDFCPKSDPNPREYKLDPQEIQVNGRKPKAGIKVTIVSAPTIVLARSRLVKLPTDYRSFRLEGRPASGWVLDDPRTQVRPDVREVTIRGPQRDVDEIERDPRKLTFEPLRIDGLDRVNVLSVALSKAEHPLLEMTPQRINVTIELRELRQDKELANARVIPINLDALVQANPKLQNLPANQSPIAPAPSDDKWKVQVTFSAPPSYWQSNPDPETLRDRLFLFVDLRPLIGSDLQVRSLPIEYKGIRGPQGEAWPDEVTVKAIRPEQLKVQLNTGK